MVKRRPGNGPWQRHFSTAWVCVNVLALSGGRVGTFLGVCYDRHYTLPTARREGQGTDCGDGFSLLLGCELIRDHACSEWVCSFQCVIYFFNTNMIVFDIMYMFFVPYK